MLKKNTFTFFISRGKKLQSKLFFGGYPEEYAKSEPTYHLVIQKTWWTLNLDAVKLNGQETGFCREKNCGVIIDTGCSGLATPQEDYDEFEKMLFESAKCEKFSSFPVVT